MKKVIVGLFLSITSIAWGVGFFACPGTTEYIYPGDSMQKVVQTCGKPAQISSVAAPASLVQQTQWVYNYKQYTNSQPNYRGLNPEFQASNLFVVNFDNNNKVARLSVGGQTVESTTFCNINQAIQVGSSDNLQVRQLCGQPSIIQTVSVKEKSTKAKKNVQWTYSSSDSYSPSTILTFQEGKVISIDQE